MKQRFTILFVVLLACVTAQVKAAEPTWLNVHYASGEVYSSTLSAVQRLEFVEEQEQHHALVVRLRDETEERTPLDELDGITFGLKKETVAVEDILATGCRVYVAGKRMLVAESNLPVLSLQVVDLSGQVVCTERFTEGQTRVCLYAPWATGLYVVLAETSVGFTSHKVVIL